VFQVNEVIRVDEMHYRILTILGDEIIWICVDDKKSFPELVLIKTLVLAIENETLKRVEDPFKDIAFMTPEKGSIQCKKRDSNYDLIKPLISHQEYFIPERRSQCIQNIIESTGSTKQTLYRLSRQYWQRGQTANSLIPDYKNSGGKGKKRRATTRKLGRPREYMEGVGALIDGDIEKLFRIAINKYLLIDNKKSFPYAHRRFKDMFENFFPDVKEEEMPTNWQMKHFFEREYQKVEKIIKQSTAIEYNKDIAPLNSTANMQVLGPGSRYEIDATIADIYLVSDSDRKNIVGRPVIYMVIDVFSRMIAGFYIGFENPSYVAAIQALANAMTDKVGYCKSLGFDIKAQDWPTVGLPNAILADRGELLGSQIESLESGFSVRIENTPPYRGDAKGIVERSFGTLQAEFKPFAPGVVQGTKVRKHGGKDYRMDAKLAVTSFKEIILSSVLIHNQSDVLEKYDREIDMPTDLPMVPLQLWNWGLQHRTGRLRSANEDALKVSLLPRVKATLSELGVCVDGMYYTSAEVIEKGWMHRSKNTNRPASIEAAYDPAVADYVYLFPEKNKLEYWCCKLTDRSREFRGSSFWDIWKIKTKQKKTTAKSKTDASKNRRIHERFVADKIEQADKIFIADDRSNKKRISAINSNKDTERENERKIKPSSPFQNEEKRVSAIVIPISNQDQDDYSFPDYTDDLFDDEDN
jgi:hypothetical protein